MCSCNYCFCSEVNNSWDWQWSSALMQSEATRTICNGQLDKKKVTAHHPNVTFCADCDVWLRKEDIRLCVSLPPSYLWYPAVFLAWWNPEERLWCHRYRHHCPILTPHEGVGWSPKSRSQSGCWRFAKIDVLHILSCTQPALWSHLYSYATQYWQDWDRAGCL